MISDLMDRVWEAYWACPGSTKEALERVVGLVLEEAAGVADDHAHGFAKSLDPRWRRHTLSERDEVVFESAQSAAVDIAKDIRGIQYIHGHTPAVQP